ALDGHAVVDGRAGQLGDGVVGRVFHREALRLPDGHAHDLVVEARRVRRGANRHGDVFVRVRGLRARLAHQIDDGRVAGLDRTGLDRLLRGGALAQPLERLLDGVVLEGDRRLAQLQRAVVARIERRHGLEIRRELQRLAFLDEHVADVRSVYRLDAPLAQRVVHGARDQVVRDVMEDLIAEALADDLRRHLAGTKARDPRGLAVIARDPVDLGVNHGAGNFDDQLLSRV